MAISLVGVGTPGTTTATVPTHAIGDLILIISFRDGSNSTPTVPGTFTSIDTVTSNSAGCVVGYRIATATNDSSGTWTNALQTDSIVFTGTDGTTPIGGHAVSTNVGTSVDYPALTMTVGTGTSWVVGLGAHRSTNTTLETPPTGMTNRVDDVTTGEVAIHDTNGGVSSWTLQTVSVGGTSSGWDGFTVEILAASSGTQTITPSLIAATTTVYTPTSVPGAVTISPSLIASTATVYTPSVAAAGSIAPTIIASTVTVYTPSLTKGVVNIVPSLLSATTTIYLPTITGGVPASIAYILAGITIPGPQSFEVTNSTLYAQNQVLLGSINRDYFGDNKRMWILKYNNTKPTTYNTLYGIYANYLFTNSPVSWTATGENYAITATTVHVDMPARSFSPSASYYISDFEVILTEV